MTAVVERQKQNLCQNPRWLLYMRQNDLRLFWCVKGKLVKLEIDDGGHDRRTPF